MISTQHRPAASHTHCDKPTISSSSNVTSTAARAKKSSAPPRLDHFNRWRPQHRLIAPKNWMNDPCGPCYDATTGLYHLLYQYNPKGATWGNMSWLHATSRDLIHWQHINQEPALVPSLPHDMEGVFSGGMLTHGPMGEEGALTAIYTAVSHLPIHFTKPYHWGSEKLAMAVSTDGGKSWKRDESSLILAGPPEELKGEVISWRDPFIADWPEMDRQLGFEPGAHLYGLISGGIKNKTPTAFLYRIDRNNVKKWTFVSMVADLGLNFSLSKTSGDMGQNWEVCNFFSLQQEQFLIMNVEGVGADLKGRHPMWANVDLQKDGAATVVPRQSGLLDHGCLYAVSTFLHEQTQRRLLWGWITEDDLAESRYEQQGWSGCMSLPREMVLLTYSGVDKKFAGDAITAASYTVTEEAGGKSIQLQTLGWRFAEETTGLRQGATHYCKAKPASGRLPIESRSVELKVEFAASDNEEAGLLLCHNASLSQYTKVVFKDGAVHVVRSHSTRDADVKTSTVSAPLPLLSFTDGKTETVRMHLVLDNSVLELFVNDRVAITTRIYCDDVDSVLVSLYSSADARTSWTQVEAWSGLQRAMIDAPKGDEGSRL